MARLTHVAFRACVSLSVAVCLVASSTASPRVKPLRKLTLDPDARSIDLFDGMREGVLSVRVVPRNEFSSRVFITNTSDRPLTVKLPKAVAAVHVLKQFQQDVDSPLTTGISQTTGTQTGNSQGVSGQLNPSGTQAFPSGNSNPFSGNGVFSVPPKKVVELQLQSVCLDHGKPTPNSKKKYVLVPLQKRVKSPELRHLLETVDLRKTDRKAVQAAVWYLSSGLSWKTLARKKASRLRTFGRPFFSRTQLQAAWNLVAKVQKDVPTKSKSQTGKTRIARNRR